MASKAVSELSNASYSILYVHCQLGRVVDFEACGVLVEAITRGYSNTSLALTEFLAVDAQHYLQVYSECHVT